MRNSIAQRSASTYEMSFVLREEGLGFLRAYAVVDNNVVTLPPIDGGRDTVLVAELESVDNPDDFVLV